MIILGITGGIESLFDLTTSLGELGHDAAAVLIEHGQVIAGLEEERSNRIKHTSKIWTSSVRFCLESAKKSLEDIDAIAFYASEDFLNDMLKQHQTSMPELNQLSDVRHLYQYLFEREFGYTLNRQVFRFINHHLAHAAATYYMSGFENCLVLTIDGEGDDVSTTIVNVENSKFITLAIKSVPDSLGHFYLNIIFFLGYGDFDEYKVMGLAPYGKTEVYKEKFKRFYSLLPNGDYTIHTDQIACLYEILTPRNRGESFTQVHKDIAAALQEALEDIVFHVLRHFQKITGQTRLAICGGVGQNSSLNGKILLSGLFEDVFAPSFAGDSGCAYGAAVYVAFQEQPRLPLARVSHVYWGSPINDDEIGNTLTSWQDFLTVEKMQNTAEKVADLIIDGAVIGWVQGRSEFGPRALGNRSILADPRLASHKDTINAMIKKREGYRPFAPSILEERVRDFFEVPVENADFPFMSFVLEVKPEWREQLPAITHVDGTARLQTVTKVNNQRYWDLINVFGNKTGIPILLNTSFNNNAEPIVDSITDAIVCFLTSGLDYLVVGDYLATKKNWGKNELNKLTVNLPNAARLISEDFYVSNGCRESSYSLVWNYEPSRQHPLSAEWYNILRHSKGTDSLDTIMRTLGITSEQVDSVIKDLPVLWSDRMIIMSPF
jgi:carbamoyltransferase